MRARPAYGGRSGFTFVDLLNDFPFADSPPECDVYLCSEETALGSNRLPGKVVAFRTRLGGGQTLIDQRRKFALLVGYVLTQADFTKKTHSGGKVRDDSPTENPLGDKWLSVPWLPFECTLHAMHEDGMWDAYLRDDLDAIRERYGSDEKKRMFGFLGGYWGWRSEIKSLYDGDDRFEIVWAGGHHGPAKPAHEYLKWMSECRGCLHLPGDTWKCSRHCEAVMMGVPVACQRGIVDLTPPITADNAILVDDWGEDREWMVALLEDYGDTKATEADKAYREGWSLRGQFTQILKRLGV